MILAEPLKVAELSEAYDIDATIHGGGPQARPAPCASASPGHHRARSRAAPGPEGRRVPLPRRPREGEQKYGLKKARKAPQYSKR